MTRLTRKISNMDFYHVMLRGINRQDIFYDDEDKINFINIMRFYAKETNVDVSAWCLMNNHVHFLLHSKGIPNEMMKRIGCAYVPYFNKKYERVGHLFQDRYRCETVNDERYLIGVVRYIHMNPEKAGLGKMEQYIWSSYSDYITGNGITSTKIIMEYFTGIEDFKSTMRNIDETKYLEYKEKTSEQEAIEIAKKVIPQNLFYLQGCGKEERTRIIKELKNNGLTVIQICRITGLCKDMIYRLIK